MDTLTKFCENPSRKNFFKLEEITQVILNASAEYCIKKGIGNINVAKEIQSYYMIKNIDENIKKGIRSLFLATKMLMTEEFTHIKKNNYPIILVYLEGDKKESFSITFGQDLPDMFIVTQTNTVLGVDKELSLYQDDMRDYFIDIFIQYPLSIDKIFIKLNEKAETLVFYDKIAGVVWSDKECYECFKKSKNNTKLDKKCEKLLKKKCYENFRHKPEEELLLEGEDEFDRDIAIIKEKKKKAKIIPLRELVNKGIECPNCMLINKPGTKKCSSCHTVLK